MSSTPQYKRDTELLQSPLQGHQEDTEVRATLLSGEAEGDRGVQLEKGRKVQILETTTSALTE